jgi:uncharacterized protein (DUF1778 family)
METPPKNNKTNTIAFRVTAEQFEKLNKFAEQDGTKNLSQWMQHLVRDEIADRTFDDASFVEATPTMQDIQ